MKKTFKELWRELCTQGWTPKPPTGLSNDHRYVRPGRSVRGKDGVDYFTGEKALMSFARQCGWLYYGATAGTKPPTASVASPAASSALPAAPTIAVPLSATLPTAAMPIVAPLTAAQPTVTTTTAAKPSAAPPSSSVVPATAQPSPPRMDVASATAQALGPPMLAVSATTGVNTSPTRVAAATAQPSDPSTPVASATAQASEPPTTAASATAEPPVLLTAVTSATAQASPQSVAVVPGTAQGREEDARMREDTALDEEEKCEVNAVDHVAEFNTYDSDRFISALAKCDWSNEPDSDDPNLCSTESEADESDEVDTDDYIAEVMNNEEDLSSDENVDAAEELSDSGEELDDSEFFEDVVNEDWSPREDVNSNPEFLSDAELKAVADQWIIYDQDHSGELQVDGAADLYNGRWGPTQSARAYAESPLGMFYYFLPKVMCTNIAEESNRYRESVIDTVAAQQQERQQRWQASHPNSRVQSLADIKDKLSKAKPFQAHEIVHYIALLIARVLCPHRRSMGEHWSTTECGAIPRGTFGKYMSRKRFEDITRFLHFNDNSNNRRKRDKAWKLRPVLQIIEKTFSNGFRMGSTLSFDEGMIGSRHQYNPMRIFMKDKPTKWGTKFYMVCCADTAYCSRIEIYRGKEDTQPAISKAVIRNLTKALRGQPGKRLVVTDNYYTCVESAERLLRMGVYTVGTTRINRKDGSQRIQFPSKKNQPRPARKVERGAYRVAKNPRIPGMVAASWKDSRVVNFLVTGCSTKRVSVHRKQKGDGVPLDVPCPELVRTYNKGMGGVDEHDQLRVHRHSIQKALRHGSYYKNLFFGIVDMALVNGYIIHNLVMKEKGKPVPTHADYLARLHVELLAQQKGDFQANMQAQNLLSAPATGLPHVLTKTTETYNNKARQYLCKVYSAYSDKEHRSFETPYYCEECTRNFGGRVALCNKVRREDSGNTDTCHQTWHMTWKNGTIVPPDMRKKIRFRKRKIEEVAEDEEEE